MVQKNSVKAVETIEMEVGGVVIRGAAEDVYAVVSGVVRQAAKGGGVQQREQQVESEQQSEQQSEPMTSEPYHVRKRRRRAHRSAWSSTEDAQLREWYAAGVPCRLIGKRLGRSEYAVGARAGVLKLKHARYASSAPKVQNVAAPKQSAPKWPLWTAAEDDIIRKYDGEKPEAFAHLLPGRTLFAIMNRRSVVRGLDRQKRRVAAQKVETPKAAQFR